MSTKKRAAKSSVQPARPKAAARKAKRRLPRFDAEPPVLPTPRAVWHTYRHEIGANPRHEPLTVDLDISGGRGRHPAMPAFVGFTAELADERWPDQFAFRLIRLQNGMARVRITRVDRGLEELSWGDNLIVHVLVVDR